MAIIHHKQILALGYIMYEGSSCIFSSLNMKISGLYCLKGSESGSEGQEVYAKKTMSGKGIFPWEKKCLLLAAKSSIVHTLLSVRKVTWEQAYTI